MKKKSHFVLAGAQKERGKVTVVETKKPCCVYAYVTYTRASKPNAFFNILNNR